jgi:uncharacterized membrane protein HdeD (DUF308 family)
MRAVTDGSGAGRTGPDEERPWLEATAPIVGLVLAVLGVMLLIQEFYPGAAWPQTAFVFVTELVTASIWAIALYVGTIVTLMTMPALLGLGVALLVAAVLRAMSGDGIGWQAIVGAVLVALGWSCVLQPPVGGPFVPVILVAIGAGLLSRRRAGAIAPPG